MKSASFLLRNYKKLTYIQLLIIMVTCLACICFPSAEMTSQLHKVFVYGTLKRGEPNHQWFSKGNEGYFTFLYEAKTKEKLPLIIATKYNIPFVLLSPGNGNFVKGEVYEVDDKVLANLDILEEHPDYYIRDLYEVIPLDGQNATAKVWIYVIKNFKQELLNLPFYESYSNSGSHGKRYIERYLRGDRLGYKCAILSGFKD